MFLQTQRYVRGWTRRGITADFHVGGGVGRDDLNNGPRCWFYNWAPAPLHGTVLFCPLSVFTMKRYENTIVNASIHLTSFTFKVKIKTNVPRASWDQSLRTLCLCILMDVSRHPGYKLCSSACECARVCVCVCVCSAEVPPMLYL